jgi:deoxyribodipyrimidine photolyase-related protein
MSDYCGKCRYDPRKTVGEDACPFSTLYYDFLARHRPRFERNARMRTQYLNLARKSAEELRAIRRSADVIKVKATAETFL